jgi:hypothetical protein
MELGPHSPRSHRFAAAGRGGLASFAALALYLLAVDPGNVICRKHFAIIR